MSVRAKLSGLTDEVGAVREMTWRHEALLRALIKHLNLTIELVTQADGTPLYTSGPHFTRDVMVRLPCKERGR